MKMFLKFIALSVALLFCMATPSYAMDVTLAWDANTEPDLNGYKVYYKTGSSGPPYNGTGASEGNSPIDLGDVTQVTLHGVSDSQTYYFVVTAYNNEVPSLESGYSNEVQTSSSSDTTAPVISNVQVTDTTDTTAVIEWTTDEASDSQVQYGNSSRSWGNYPSTKTDARMVTSHSVNLTGLTDSTTYYFRVGSTDAPGNGPTTSGEDSFTTDPTPEYTVQGLPSDLRSSTPESDTVVLTLNSIPSGTNSIELMMTVLDADFNDEGRLFVNGQGPIALFGGQGVGSNDGISVTLGAISTDAAWYQLGQNTLTLWHDSTGGFVIEDISVNFSTQSIDTNPPSIVQYPNINYTNGTIDVTYDESNMQNATTEANYSFSPSLLFGTLGGSDDIIYIGSNTYRLSMAFIPSYTILTLTLSDITDESGNPVASNSIRINDNDNDDMPDDWESDKGVSDPNGDSDGDGLDNLGEYNHNTDPKSSDTDGDSLPDGWEVTYGLDPNDETGVNGANGDFDNDGWTNYEEYTNSYNPASNNSPGATSPDIKRTIPRDNSGITNGKQVSSDTSFAVLIESKHGVDITDKTSIKLTIADSVNPAYERDLSDSTVVRVVKLTSDADTQITKLWAVYDRSKDDEYGNSYAFDTNINIKVDVKNKKGKGIDPRPSYAFKIESEEEQEKGKGKRPPSKKSTGTDSTTITVTSSDDLGGFEVVYDTSEPITPYVRSSGEIPSVDIPGVTPVGIPVNLGPPTVFNNPVKLIIPCPGQSDVRDLNLYLYDGFEWMYASSSYNTDGEVQPDGEGWMVPGSLVYHNDADPPTLEVQVHHFSAIQAGFVTDGGSALEVNGDSSGAGGGCFISTSTVGSDMEWHMQVLREFRDKRMLTSRVGRRMVNIYYKFSPPVADYLRKHPSAKAAVKYALIPITGATYLGLYVHPVILLCAFILLVVTAVYFMWHFSGRRRRSSLAPLKSPLLAEKFGGEQYATAR